LPRGICRREALVHRRLRRAGVLGKTICQNCRHNLSKLVDEVRERLAVLLQID
jgi:hypothetical protein